MASTPLYKRLKKSGTTTYVFPSAGEDISAAYSNSNYKMYFSKFILLNFPKQNTLTKTQKSVMDFDNEFYKSINSNSNANTTFDDKIIESLRNYVANQEVVIKESRLNTKEYYYNTNVLSTMSEKIFFKWAKKCNLIDFELASNGDDYFGDNTDFASNNINDTDYLTEHLWKERTTSTYNIYSFLNYNGSGYLYLKFSSKTNIKTNDFININNVENGNLTQSFVYYDTNDGITLKVIDIINNDDGTQLLKFNKSYNGDETNISSGDVTLIYNKFVQYIGEISGLSNVQEANRNYTEVYAHIPDGCGQTPTILFRTLTDDNYRPNLTFPIIPSQIQPEIMGAENFSSPIVNTPSEYPGSYYAEFDTDDYQYTTATGDELRKSGKYYGLIDNNNIMVDDNNRCTIDGITVDFNTSHYVKMNIYRNIVTTFDKFNTLEINNEPPKDFEFNAILWYYTVEKTESDGSISTANNLYGISFFDNPNNNIVTDEKGIRFPIYKKLVATDEHDGTSYAFSLNLNFNIINDNPQQTYNPNAINSLFNMNLFNDAMSRLASTNDSFLKTISNYDNLVNEIDNIKQLLYTTTDIKTINTKIKNLENLLKMYSTMQITDSNSIVTEILEGTPTTLSLTTIDAPYDNIINIKTSDLYSSTNIIPYNIDVPQNKAFLINITNDDTNDITLTNNNNLKILINKDLYYKQSLDIIINSNTSATENKKIDICINNTLLSTNISSTTTEALLLGDINLPIYNYTTTDDNGTMITSLNSSYNQSKFNFKIDLNKDIKYDNTTDYLTLFIDCTDIYNIAKRSISIGDVIILNNLLVEYISNTQSKTYDFSYQTKIEKIITNDNDKTLQLFIDITNNSSLYNFVNTENTENKTYYLHKIDSDDTYPELMSIPYFSFNKGMKIKITCINDNNTALNNKYLIEKTYL